MRRQRVDRWLASSLVLLVVGLAVGACRPAVEVGERWDRAPSVERPPEVVAQAMPPTYRHPGHFSAQAVVTAVAHRAGVWVAVGYAGPPWRAVAWWSADARSWPLAAVEATEGTFLEAVTADADGFLAAGRAWDGGAEVPAVWRSIDGRSWERIPDVAATAGRPARIAAVAAGPDGVRVAGGSSGPELGPWRAALWRSTDGRTWTGSQVTSAEGARVAAIAPGPGGGFVAVGWRDLGSGSSEAAAWSSADGRSWTGAPAGTASAFADGRIRGIASLPGGRGLVAVGTDAAERRPRVWRSDDGTTWEALDAATVGYHGQTVRMLAVAALPDRGVIAVGNYLFGTQYGSARVWRSTDGRSWSSAIESDTFAQGEMLSVAVDPEGGVAVAVGSFGAPDSYLPTIWVSPAPR